MPKKVDMSSQPRKSRTLAAWAENRDEELTRVTFEAPASLHRRFKSVVSLRGQKMRDLFVAFMEETVKDADA